MKNIFQFTRRTYLPIIAVIILCSAGFSGCDKLDTALQNVVIFNYDHVANAHQIRFDETLQLPGNIRCNSVNPAQG